MHEDGAGRKPCLSLGQDPNNAHPWGSDVPDILGRWIYVTAVFKKDGDNFMFIDRKKSAAMTKTNNAPQDGTPDLYVGCPSTSASNGCDCWVKEVKVFDRVLSDDDIHALSDQFHDLIDIYTPTFQWGNNILTDVKDMVTMCGHLFVLTKEGKFNQRKDDGTWEDLSSYCLFISQSAFLVKYEYSDDSDNKGTLAIVQVVEGQTLTGSENTTNISKTWSITQNIEYTNAVDWHSKLTDPKYKIKMNLFQVTKDGIKVYRSQGIASFKVARPHFLSLAHHMVVVGKKYLDSIIKKSLSDKLNNTIQRSILFRV